MEKLLALKLYSLILKTYKRVARGIARKVCTITYIQIGQHSSGQADEVVRLQNFFHSL